MKAAFKASPRYAELMPPKEERGIGVDCAVPAGAGVAADAAAAGPPEAKGGAKPSGGSAPAPELQ
eukprot:8988100-Pyramimonas_sp.AAC.1